jgi:hypothetical protein
MKASIASLKKGVLRPRDAKAIYTQPALQFKRLEKTGVLLKLAHGYYLHVPEAMRGKAWRPEMEALALALGQADYGKDEVALMHISAARIHGALPRAIALAVLAVPKQRPILETKFGRIIFVKREVSELQRMRIDTELGSGWATNLEQTTLDLAKRENLILDFEEVVQEAAVTLFLRVGRERLSAFATKTDMVPSFSKVESWVRNA